MIAGLLSLLMIGGSLQAYAGVWPDDTTTPQGQVRRLSESEIATYVVNHGIWPAGLVGELGEIFRPNGTYTSASRGSRAGTYKVENDRLCVSVSMQERCRALYIDEVGVVFSAAVTGDGTEGVLIPLDADWLKR